MSLSPRHLVPVWRHGGDAEGAEGQDWVIDESPVAMVFNGVSHAVMMATPTDLEDFGLGFALSEGIIGQPGECHDLEVRETAQGIEIAMTIATRAFEGLKQQRRTLAGRTGCGLCGRDSLGAFHASHPRQRLAPGPTVTAEALRLGFASLSSRQPLQAATGGCHAAGWIDASGTLHAVREDVGRHNALDKLIGHLAQAGGAGASGIVLVSSRASFELVSKCARLGLPALAAISAPTSMAVSLAQATGVELWGFCRPGSLVRYAAAAAD